MQRQPEAQPLLFTVRDLTRDDLARLEAPRADTSTPKVLRDTHHRVARLVASGLRLTEVAQRTGYSYGRVTMLIKSPAFQELVALYREKVLEAFVQSEEDFIELATSNMLRAQRMIAERLEEADDEGAEAVPIRTLLAISADAADRVGYGKKQTNLNINADFAKALEKAYAEQTRIIESRAVPPARRTLEAPQPSASGEATVPHEVASPPSSAPVVPARRPEKPRAPDAGVTVERGAAPLVRRA